MIIASLPKVFVWIDAAVSSNSVLGSKRGIAVSNKKPSVQIATHGPRANLMFFSQVSKQGMSNRVVDELNPDMLLTRKDLAVLLDFKDEEAPPPDTR